MDKVVRDKWVAELRSGKYEQAQSALKEGDKYCCLGVLCLAQGWNPEIEDTNDPDYPVGWEATPEGKWTAGLSQIEMIELYEMNDADTPFETIADYIEENISAEEA